MAPLVLCNYFPSLFRLIGPAKIFIYIYIIYYYIYIHIFWDVVETTTATTSTTITITIISPISGFYRILSWYRWLQGKCKFILFHYIAALPNLFLHCLGLYWNNNFPLTIRGNPKKKNPTKYSYTSYLLYFFWILQRKHFELKLSGPGIDALHADSQQIVHKWSALRHKRLPGGEPSREVGIPHFMAIWFWTW